MAYRLKLTEPAAAGLRRIASEDLARCLPVVRRGKGAALWVHETRKCLKRTRALLRLLRAGIADKTWRRENVALRDIARALALRRERDVLPATIESLSRAADADLAAALGRLRVALAANARDENAPPPPSLSVVARDIAAARERLARLEVEGAPAELLAAGVAATHARGRTWLAAVERDGDDEAVHELRKAVQTHWRQMQLVEPAWPELIGPRARAARGLAALLGDHQDLAGLVLAVRVTAGLGRLDCRLILRAAAGRQARIRAEVLPAARRLFAAEPKSFAAETAELWLAAVDLRRATKAAAAANAAASRIVTPPSPPIRQAKAPGRKAASPARLGTLEEPVG